MRITTLVTTTLMVLAAHPVALGDTIAYWRFEEGADGSGAIGAMPGTSGHVISEAHSPALNGTSCNGAPHYVSDIPGPAIDSVGSNNLALYFDGNDAWKVLDNALLDFGPGDGSTGDFTIELFLKLDPAPNNGATYRIIQKRNFPNAGYDTWVWTGADSGSLVGQVALTLKDTAGGFRQPRSNMRIDDSEWHHLAFRRYWNGSSVRSEVWVDYELRGSGGGGATGSLANSRDLFVGRSIQQATGYNFYTGWMDEIRISDEAIAPTEFLHIVPEPASAACLLIGLGLAGVGRRGNRR